MTIRLVRANGQVVLVPFNPLIEVVAKRVPVGPPRLKFRFEEEHCQTTQKSLEQEKREKKRPG